MADFIPNGNGKLTFPDGRNWEGEFQIGKMSGAGIMRSAKGRTLRQGIWSNNEFVGKGNNPVITPAMSRQQSFVKKIAGVNAPATSQGRRGGQVFGAGGLLSALSSPKGG